MTAPIEDAVPAPFIFECDCCKTAFTSLHGNCPQANGCASVVYIQNEHPPWLSHMVDGPPPNDAAPVGAPVLQSFYDSEFDEARFVFLNEDGSKCNSLAELKTLLPWAKQKAEVCDVCIKALIAAKRLFALPYDLFS